MSAKPTAARPRPQTVKTSELRPNPHNPRMLFDDLPLQTLEDSLRKVGVLVPLTVFRAKGSDHYTILDGQRRWICAQRAGLKEVPINEVSEPSTAANIITMFQIHKLREDWELMPTALKLGVLMKELDEKRDKPLAEHTGLDEAVVVRCKKLLWYPEKYQNMMLFVDPNDRIKADFFIEMYSVLTDRMISGAKFYKRDEFINRFLFKYQNKLSDFKAVTDFRKIKQFATIARRSGHEQQFLNKFQKFLYDDTIGISFLEISAASIRRRAEKIGKSIENIQQELTNMEISATITLTYQLRYVVVRSINGARHVPSYQSDLHRCRPSPHLA